MGVIDAVIDVFVATVIETTQSIGRYRSTDKLFNWFSR